uniref:Uncharacterized protein n=1 Tax=Chromera velia CCMP2878 TaxID=1169474 RepID=A0A0G4HWF6_9ALVE|eukprot:Cvel_9036.t1-p1 / transcript=Cvel_9036.t1 / gene=Cvel_9036 / organism=Chromera_velia_CCMP2878 / gene_product=hypothetical protein / transcript_product=hypothetical protein / location=Cvel_scaffold512:38942-39328(-) / protein_length=129 / sequence_SO=supercontig / SO=protein_coding / is_pseudo=false
MVWGHTVAQSLTKPSKRIFKTVVQVLEVMKANPNKRIFRGIRGDPVVHAYFDAAFVLATYEARLGYAIRVLDSCFLPASDEKEALFLNWIAWATKRASRRVGLSTLREALGLEFLLKKLVEILHLLKEM